MPQVPIYQRQVGPGIAPGAYLSPNAPQGAFGEGVAQGMENMGRAASEIAAVEKQKADQVAAQHAFNLVDDSLQGIKYDPQAGLMYTQGQNAYGIVENGMAAFDKSASEIEQKNVHNEAQARAFAAYVADKRHRLKGLLERHFASQRVALDGQTTEARIENFNRDGIEASSDPTRIGQLATQIKQTTAAYAARNGQSGDVVEDLTTERIGKFYGGILHHLIQLGDHAGAQAFYKAHKDDLLPADADQFGEHLKGIDRDKQTQALADQATAKYPDDLSKALEWLKDKTANKPEAWRDEATQRMVAGVRLQAQAHAQRQNYLVTQADGLLDKVAESQPEAPGTPAYIFPTPHVPGAAPVNLLDRVKASMGKQWDEMDPANQAAIKQVAAQMQNPVPAQTDLPAWRHVWKGLGNKQRANLSASDLVQIRTTFDTHDFNELKTWIKHYNSTDHVKAASGGGNGGSASVPITFQNEIIINHMEDAGFIDPKTGDPAEGVSKHTIHVFKERMHEEFMHAKNMQDMRAMATNAVMEVLIPAGGSQPVPVVSLTPEQKLNATITYDLTPPRARASILLRIASATGKRVVISGTPDENDYAIVQDLNGAEHRVYVGDLYGDNLKTLVTKIYTAEAKGDTATAQRLLDVYAAKVRHGERHGVGRSAGEAAGAEIGRAVGGIAALMSIGSLQNDKHD